MDISDWAFPPVFIDERFTVLGTLVPCVQAIAAFIAYVSDPSPHIPFKRTHLGVLWNDHGFPAGSRVSRSDSLKSAQLMFIL